MKAVIIYYSYSGNTKKIAEMVQRETGFSAAELRTVVPYSENYDVVVDQGQDEVKRGFMPEILPLEVNPEEYDTVFLGMPVWWYTYAPAVKTFLAQYKLAGKTILPFATNGGWIGHTLKDIAVECKGASVKEGLDLHFNGAKLMTDKAKLENWIKTIK